MYMIGDNQATDGESGGEQSYEITVYVDEIPNVGDRIQFQKKVGKSYKTFRGECISRQPTEVDEYWDEGGIEVVTLKDTSGDEHDLYYGGPYDNIHARNTYPDGYEKWESTARLSVERNAIVTVPENAVGKYSLDDELTEVDGIGKKTSSRLRGIDTVGEYAANREVVYHDGIRVRYIMRDRLFLSRRVDSDLRHCHRHGDDITIQIIDGCGDETNVSGGEKLVTDGGYEEDEEDYREARMLCKSTARAIEKSDLRLVSSNDRTPGLLTFNFYAPNGDRGTLYKSGSSDFTIHWTGVSHEHDYGSASDAVAAAEARGDLVTDGGRDIASEYEELNEEVCDAVHGTDIIPATGVAGTAADFALQRGKDLTVTVQAFEERSEAVQAHDIILDDLSARYDTVEITSTSAREWVADTTGERKTSPKTWYVKFTIENEPKLVTDGGVPSPVTSVGEITERCDDLWGDDIESDVEFAVLVDLQSWLQGIDLAMAAEEGRIIHQGDSYVLVAEEDLWLPIFDDHEEPGVVDVMTLRTSVTAATEHHRDVLEREVGSEEAARITDQQDVGVVFVEE